MRLVVLLLAVLLTSPAKADVYQDIWTTVSEASQLALDGATDSAYARAERVLPLALSQNETLAAVLLQNIIGTAQRAHGHDQEALKAYLQAENLISQLPQDDMTRLKNTVYLINMYASMAELYNDLKKKKEACRYARIVVKEAEKKDDKAIRGTVFTQAGGVLMECGQAEEAARWLRQGYRDALEADLPGNALVAASHLMLIEDATTHCHPSKNTWKKKADSLLPHVHTDYPKGVYYSSLSHINLTSGELTEVHKAQEKAMELEGMRKLMTPERTKEYLRQAEEEQEAVYAQRHQSRVRLITSSLIGVLIIFACYVLWIQYRRKRMQEEVEHQMGERFIEGMESERNRLARELHDGISNQLLAVEMKLESDGPTDQARRLLAESRERVRHVSHELMPPEFSHHTLDELLAQYVNSVNGAHSSDITYQSTPENAIWSDIPSDAAFEAYRITQEAIGNALKHAGASTIAVGMKKEDGSITITVADNGTQPDIATSADGIGSRTMLQRAQTINGTLTTKNTRFGTIVQLSFSLT